MTVNTAGTEMRLRAAELPVVTPTSSASMVTLRLRSRRSIWLGPAPSTIAATEESGTVAAERPHEGKIQVRPEAAGGRRGREPRCLREVQCGPGQGRRFLITWRRLKRNQKLQAAVMSSVDRRSQTSVGLLPFGHIACVAEETTARFRIKLFSCAAASGPSPPILLRASR